eukprot:379457_1
MNFIDEVTRKVAETHVAPHDAYNKTAPHHAIALLPPKLVPRAWNIIAKKREDATKECAEQGLQFMLYHKRQYMGSGQYIKEWNHYRDFVRCNNQLENKNGIINRLCGSHPFLFEFQYLLAQYYNDEYIAYDQFIKHGATNKRHKREILKNKLLIRAWDFIDKDKSMGYVNTKDEDIVVFMKYASIALKGNAAQIEKMLQRKMW